MIASIRGRFAPRATLHKSVIAPLVAIAIAGLLFAACDNPVEGDGDEHAEEVVGLALLVDDQEILRVEEVLVNDTLRIGPGESSGIIDIEFLDHDGNVVPATELEEAFELGLVVDDPSIIETEFRGDWSFVLMGLDPGETMLRIQLLHLPQRHADFRRDIPVAVR